MFYAAFESTILSFDSKADRAAWLGQIGLYGFSAVSHSEAQKIATPEQRRRERMGYCLSGSHWQRNGIVWSRQVFA